MARVFRAALAFVMPLLVAAPGWSQAESSPPTSYSLSWVRAGGAEQCPASRALVTEVERRLGRKVFDVVAERSFEVEVTRTGEQYRSDVYLRDGDGRTLGHRALQSDERDCAALANATALAIALLIDPSAAEREPARGVAEFEPPPLEVKPPPQAAPAPATVPEPAPASPPPPARRRALPPESVTVSTTLRGELALGVAPQTSPGVAIAVHFQPGARWGFELGAGYTLPQNATVGLGSLDLGLTRADALLTLEAGRSGAVRLMLGAGASLGAFHLAVRQPAPVTEPGDYAFVAARGLTSLQVTVTNYVFAEVGAAGLVALKRQQFLVRPQLEPVWRQSVVSGVLFGGLGVRFP